ncbi:MAG: NFACT RNA binding domain-containing protein, partial [Candidatus Krumholzibacteria bacterium]|nr:NFACT RNA binding domain-containing protein [Candidatus Krumholzibacteria bacterium]
LPRRAYSILELPAEPPEELLHGTIRAEPSVSAPEHTLRWKDARTAALALSSSIGGIDPVLASVLSKRAGGDVARVWPMLADVAGRIASRAWTWHLYEFPEEGEAGLGALYPIELPIEERGERKKDFLDAVGARADAVVIPSYVANLKRKAAAGISKELKRLARLGRNLEEDLDDAQRSGEYRHYGELLATYRHLLQAGMKEIVVKDFSGERKVEIPLDPARSPDRNIRLYFNKAKKGEKGAHIIRNRKRETERESARDRDRLDRIERLESPAELIKIIPRELPPRAAEREAGAARRFRRFVIDASHTVYVGRSDAENDILTHEFASPADLWFHAQGTPGSHVILKGAHRSTPNSVIERAASIAAYYSKARNSSTVPVIYAEKRYVRRPRKSKAGTALCSRGKTIFVKPALPEE